MLPPPSILFLCYDPVFVGAHALDTAIMIRCSRGCSPRAPACNVILYYNGETFEGENFCRLAFRDGNFHRMLN